LFGWSETKAQARLVERRERIAHASSEWQAERRRSAVLREKLNSHEVRKKSAEAARETEGSAREIQNALEEARILEREAPTPLGSSRARRLGEEIATLQSDPSLSSSQKKSRLASLRQQLARLRAVLNLPPP
jgi:hypothetical protein